VFQKAMDAMDLLKKNKCLFGISVCYTRENIDSVTSDDFADLMIAKGVKYAWYFNYMPVGKGAVARLIPTPAQRKHMYYWVRKMRSGKNGKPMFVIDFQDDGEYVGGCIAGGRNYFHINSAGDIEPCVFIHYSDSNIRTHTLLEALQNPLFMAYRKNQPFNDNHLRPCPMLENPELLRKMVKETGAKSTNLLCSEEVDVLCGKCDEFALAWQPVADELWSANNHPVTHTQYYRDGGKAKRQ
jgi:MoaA/NifB/PqqE/SkfB family radical SAM enzyme